MFKIGLLLNFLMAKTEDWALCYVLPTEIQYLICRGEWRRDSSGRATWRVVQVVVRVYKLLFMCVLCIYIYIYIYMYISLSLSLCIYIYIYI